MKIAVIAHIRHAIAEPFMGGMEAHCRLLCDGLRSAGHDVTLFAADRSRDANLAAICDAPYEDVLPWRKWRGTPELAAYQQRAFAGAWHRILSEGFDVVHNNSLFPEIMEWAARDGMPCVTSQHVPPFQSMRDAVETASDYRNVQQTVTSSSQLAMWSARARRHMAVVHNGVRTDRWLPHADIGDHFVWLGRITPNKGTSEALRAARIAGKKLHIYGPVEDGAYFSSEVEPFLKDGVEYRGHISLQTLRPIVAGASGVVVTPLWDEPFGLVAAEALSCGTPVCAYDSGALPEVVGECGHVVAARDIAALADAMSRVEEIDRAACRRRAIKRFSSHAMIAGYEQAYERAIDALLDQAAFAFSSSHSRTSALLA
ncbi:MAG: glycosyltransferase [Erythrobacter sp.]|uniref:glycosyltransferase n=1 Tax=Erythrobacter sp. TaxID=1042 RepID=UPI003C75ACE2